MSTFVYASDLHGNVRAYEQLFAIPADAVVLGGDLLPHPPGSSEQVIDLQREFARAYLAPKLAERPCFWLLGNDDWECLSPLLEGNGTPIHRRSVNFLDGYSIAGYSCVPVTPFGMKDFDRYDGEGWVPPSPPARCLFSGESGVRPGTLEEVKARGTIAADLEALAALSNPDRTVYVMHSPPHGTSLDRLSDGTPVGSRAIRDFIGARQPPLTMHGHIHESPGIQRIGRTTSANPGDSVQGLRALRVDLETLSVTPLR